MHDIRLNPVEHFGISLIDPGSPIAILVARVVHNVKGDRRIVRIALDPESVVGGKGVFFSGEDMHLVMVRKAETQGLAIDLGSAL